MIDKMHGLLMGLCPVVEVSPHQVLQEVIIQGKIGKSQLAVRTPYTGMLLRVSRTELHTFPPPHTNTDMERSKRGAYIHVDTYNRRRGA